MAGNRPARERFEFSLDARQVAGVILGSLGALGLAFFLGHSLGRRVAERPAVAARPAAPVAAPADPLAALDQAPRPDGGEPSGPLSFHEALTSARPPPDRLPPPAKGQAAPTTPPERAQAAAPAPAPKAAPAVAPPPVAASQTAPVAAAVAAPVGASTAAPATAPAVEPPAAPTGSAASAPAPAVALAPPAAAPAKVAPAKGAWVIQVGSTQERFEAERIAARFASRGARVTVADVPGKGRWYRVRLGSFDTRDAADRYLRDLEKSTGARGFVASAN
jgi:cell division septation protein DedD